MRILHISDVHFGLWPRVAEEKDGVRIEPRSRHYFADDNGEPDPKELPRVLQQDPECASLDAIVCSGDIGWSGYDQDYHYALLFFQELRRIWPCAPLVLVPGNHDVDQSVASKDDAQDSYLRLIRQLYGSDFQTLHPLHEPSKRRKPTRHDLVTLHQIGDSILIVGVNSAAELHTGETAKTPIFVAPRTLQAIEGHLRSLDPEKRALRLFVVHHHLFPFAELPWGDVVNPNRWVDQPDPTLISNSARLQGWLASNGFQLLLHGHKHLAHVREDTLWRPGVDEHSRLLAVSAGSAGVHEGERGAEPLTYNVIEATRAATARWEVAVIKRNIVNRHMAWQAAEGGRYETVATVTPPPSVPLVIAKEKPGQTAE